MPDSSILVLGKDATGKLQVQQVSASNNHSFMAKVQQITALLLHGSY